MGSPKNAMCKCNVHGTYQLEFLIRMLQFFPKTHTNIYLIAFFCVKIVPTYSTSTLECNVSFVIDFKIGSRRIFSICILEIGMSMSVLNRYVTQMNDIETQYACKLVQYFMIDGSKVKKFHCIFVPNKIPTSLMSSVCQKYY